MEDHPSRVFVDPEMSATIDRLRRAGFSWDHIARKVGVSHNIARRHAREVLGIDTSVRLSRGQWTGCEVIDGRYEPDERTVARKARQSGRQEAATSP